MKILPTKRQKHRERLADLYVPDPWSVDEFCAGIARRRGRPLLLLPVPASPGTERMCGAWAATAAADFVFVADNTSSWHREQIILHECAHMLCGHAPSVQSMTDWLREALPAGRWNPKVLAGVLWRSRYDLPVELEAEELAGLIEARVPRGTGLRRPAQAPASAEADEVLDRLARALGAGER